MMLRNRDLNVKSLAIKDEKPEKKTLKRIAQHDESISSENRSPVAKHIPKDEKPNKQLDYTDYDKETEKDIVAMAPYAQDIFKWYKSRECLFKLDNYYNRQPHITSRARAKIVDWVVDLQQIFELNHETLYLSVKLFDLFMDRTQRVIDVDDLQLIASAAVFVATKFDVQERSPPLIDDFVYTCEDMFNRDDLTSMERELFQTVGFDLGAPLSYRFLRRYSRVTKTTMQTLTLARYILETSLLFLDFCLVSESLIATASFLLALRMENRGQDWSSTLEHYSGYSLKEVEPLAYVLNHMMYTRQEKHYELQTIFNKYSHENFFRVALKPLLPDRFGKDKSKTSC